MKDEGRNKLTRVDNLPGQPEPQRNDLERQERYSFFESLNTAFPLSGGEPDIDLFASNDEEDDLEFKKKLNTTFPLSGGETDDDFRHAMGEEDEEEQGDNRALPKQIGTSSDKSAGNLAERNGYDDSHIET